MAREPEPQARILAAPPPSSHIWPGGWKETVKAALVFAGSIAFLVGLLLAAYFVGIDSGFETARTICGLTSANPLDPTIGSPTT